MEESRGRPRRLTSRLARIRKPASLPRLIRTRFVYFPMHEVGCRFALRVAQLILPIPRASLREAVLLGRISLMIRTVGLYTKPINARSFEIQPPMGPAWSVWKLAIRMIY